MNVRGFFASVVCALALGHAFAMKGDAIPNDYIVTVSGDVNARAAELRAAGYDVYAQFGIINSLGVRTANEQQNLDLMPNGKFDFVTAVEQNQEVGIDGGAAGGFGI